MYQVQSNNLQTIEKRNLDSIGGGHLIKKSDNGEVRGECKCLTGSN